MKCRSKMAMCRCDLERGHEQVSPHLCRCGGMWDEYNRVVAWPKPDGEIASGLRERWPTGSAQSSWRYDSEQGIYVRTEDEASAR